MSIIRRHEECMQRTINIFFFIESTFSHYLCRKRLAVRPIKLFIYQAPSVDGKSMRKKRSGYRNSDVSPILPSLLADEYSKPKFLLTSAK